jgi:hypothetical protein
VPACRSTLAGILALALGGPATAQEVFRCTTADGRVTYQQAPCPKTDQERKVDATPANTDFDASKREQILKQGEEAGKRLEERAAREAEEAKRRREEREREERLEREAQEREALREPAIIYGGWPNRPIQPVPPSRPATPRPTPRPAPPPSGR